LSLCTEPEVRRCLFLERVVQGLRVSE